MACCSGCKKTGGSCGGQGRKRMGDQGGWRFGANGSSDEGESSWVLPAAALGLALLVFSKKK